MDINAREKLFYEVLGAVPEVPAGVLEKVERSVRRSGVKRRATLAACLLLAFIIPASLVIFNMNNRAAYADDHGSMDELLYAFEFLNGDGDKDAYPLLDDIQVDDSAAVAGAAPQQPPSEPAGNQLTKKLSEKGLSNEK
ncbi:MAG: hypothetical protein LBB74_01655 [Chitinispirillales bacterium]|jgi:hypothetical protein|nr:hypothetical protein [Chitinispirillales bacterium]